MPSYPGLGRIPERKPEQDRHPLRARLADVPVVRRNKRWPSFTWPLDQGRTGTCCGHGGKHWEITAPVIRTKRLGPPTAIDIYLKATTFDPWHGGKPDATLQDGTSVNAVMLALRELGYVAEFIWEFDDLDPILDYVSTTSGVILGIDWPEAWFTTTPEGFLRDLGPNEDWVGGHCIFCDEVNFTRGYIGGPNSWGRPIDFGKVNPKTGLSDGRWRMSFEAAREVIIRRNGECCAAIETRAP